MTTLSNWIARRSGGRITVTGQDAQKRTVRLTEIDEIAVRRDGEIVAVKVGRDVAVLAARGAAA